ncbi:unnamed protein product [Adineta steineri]|uniref:Uncharacterized protein n=1 Tax=Adineta steineri TaxID=433720 RepID=A0A818WI83_9BILA|nr:unnamed protein product [Adineta steineri]CAF3725255.1 unnamed protein product [Adineta steineri]
MEEQSIKFLEKLLKNWSNVEVRTVPKVMYQVLCGKNDTDTGENSEYRFHWFMDCSETYIHNHQFSFQTYCLDGEYEEKVWELKDDHNGGSTYKFPRISGNKFGQPVRIPGVLSCVKTNHHFSGNTLHVDRTQYHSISPKPQTNTEALTFVARRRCSTAKEMGYVLNSSDIIEAPTEEIRVATFEERLEGVG